MTVVAEYKYKGNDMIGVFDEEPVIDEKGETKSFPIVGMGLRKVSALLPHVEALQIFAENRQSKIAEAEAKKAEKEKKELEKAIELLKKKGLSVAK